MIITMQGRRNSFHSDVMVVETGKVRINLRSLASSIGDFKSEIKDNNFFYKINFGIDTPQNGCSTYTILKVWTFIYSREFM